MHRRHEKDEAEIYIYSKSVFPRESNARTGLNRSSTNTPRLLEQQCTLLPIHTRHTYTCPHTYSISKLWAPVTTTYLARLPHSILLITHGLYIYLRLQTQREKESPEPGFHRCRRSRLLSTATYTHTHTHAPSHVRRLLLTHSLQSLLIGRRRTLSSLLVLSPRAPYWRSSDGLSSLYQPLTFSIYLSLARSRTLILGCCSLRDTFSSREPLREPPWPCLSSPFAQPPRTLDSLSRRLSVLLTRARTNLRLYCMHGMYFYSAREWERRGRDGYMDKYSGTVVEDLRSDDTAARAMRERVQSWRRWYGAQAREDMTASARVWMGCERDCRVKAVIEP